jgi:hypothetical protein
VFGPPLGYSVSAGRRADAGLVLRDVDALGWYGRRVPFGLFCLGGKARLTDGVSVWRALPGSLDEVFDLLVPLLRQQVSLVGDNLGLKHPEGRLGISNQPGR